MGETAPTVSTVTERELAIRLHALSKKEQTRMLRQVPEDERNILKKLLKELEFIGIPKVALNHFANQCDDSDEYYEKKEIFDTSELEVLTIYLENQPAAIRQLILDLTRKNSDFNESCAKVGVTAETASALIDILKSEIQRLRLCHE